MEFQLSYFKSWKMMLWKCCTRYVNKFWKLSSGHRTGKGQFSFQSLRRAMPKSVQTIAQLHSSHMLVKQCSKFSKLGFNSVWTENFQVFKLDLEKAEEPEIKLPTPVGSQKKQESSRKNIYFCFIDYGKALDCVDHHKLWKILRNGHTRSPYLPHEKPVYAGQEATVKIKHGTTNWFKIGKGVSQGCLLSLYLFNLDFSLWFFQPRISHDVLCIDVK